MEIDLSLFSTFDEDEADNGNRAVKSLAKYKMIPDYYRCSLNDYEKCRDDFNKNLEKMNNDAKLYSVELRDIVQNDGWTLQNYHSYWIDPYLEDEEDIDRLIDKYTGIIYSRFFNEIKEEISDTAEKLRKIFPLQDRINIKLVFE